MFMRRVSVLLPATVLVVAGAGASVAVSASERATATIAATAQLTSRTSLTVSAETLRFDVTSPGAAAIVSVEFVASARTHGQGEVVLTVEPVRGIEGPGGASDLDAAVAFSGDGAGTQTGLLRTADPVVAGRWTGSGRRTGRLRFSLNTDTIGAYSLPVRFVLSAP
jgi:hypothetical protein